VSDRPVDRAHLFVAQLGDQLAQQERVAAGELRARRAEAGVRRDRVVAELRAHDLGDRRATERMGRECGRRRIGLQLGQSRIVGLAGADGNQQQDREVGAARGEVGEETQRLRIDPVGVVDDDEHRALLGEVRRQPVQAVEHRERRVLTSACR
jgi:hypothetical protein